MKGKFLGLILCFSVIATCLVGCSKEDNTEEVVDEIVAEPIVSDEEWENYYSKLALFAEDYNTLLKATSEGYLTDANSLSCLDKAKDLISRTSQISHSTVTAEELDAFNIEIEELSSEIKGLTSDVNFDVSATANVTVSQSTYQSLLSTADELEQLYNTFCELSNELGFYLEGDDAMLSVDIEDYIVKARAFNEDTGLEDDAQAYISAMIQCRFELQEIITSLE